MRSGDVFNMSVDMPGPNSVVTVENPFDTNLISLSSYDLNVLSNRDQIVCGYPDHSMLQGDNNNLQACIHGQNSDRGSDSYTLGSVLPERETIGNFLYGTPCPTNNTQVPGQYMEGMPLSAASTSTLLSTRWNPCENLENFASCAPLVNSLEVPRSVNLNCRSDAHNTSSQASMWYGHEGVPLGTSSKWDFNNFVADVEPSEVTGRRGLQPSGLMVTNNPDGWVTSQNTRLSSDSPGSSRLSNELSLSLATSNPSVVCSTSIQDQYSEICCSDGQHVGSEQISCSRNLSLGFDSSKPFQLSRLLLGSQFVHVIQEILAEVAYYSIGNLDLTNYTSSGIEDQANVSFYPSNIVGENYSEPASDDSHDAAHRVAVQMGPTVQGWEVERKKKHLLALLQVVDDRYSQCLDEIHTVISAFHAVTELNPQTHARFALQTMSFLYKNLRERISNHILAMGVHFSKEVTRKEEKSFEVSFIEKQWALQQLRRKDNQLWRPQRGLPERSVSVLRAWMFQNFLHPYPKDAEKHLLALKSGLTRSQVSNWFINARVRLWKPMIEEMCAEMNRRKSRQNIEETNSNQRSQIRIENQRFAMF